MKALKIAGIVVATLALIVYFTSDFFLEKRLRYELSKLIAKDSVKLYEYDFSKFNLNLIDGSVKLKGVKIHPTSIALDSLHNPNNNVRVLIDATFKEIKMEGFEVQHFLKTGKIVINKFIVDKPKFIYLFNSEKEGNKSSITLDNVLSNSFTQASLDHFIIKNASITVNNIQTEKDFIVFKDFDFHLTNAYVDSETIKRFSPFNYDNIEFSIGKLTMEALEDFSVLTEHIYFNAEKNTTTLSNVKLKPKYSQKNFSKKYKVQKAWFALELDTLRLTNIDFGKLIQYGDIQVGQLKLVKANLGIFKDKTKLEPPFKKKLLPSSLLKKIPFSLSIDTIKVRNSTITINEKSPISKKVSELSLNDLNVSIYGFTNDSAQIGSNKFMVVNATTNLMRVSPVSFQARFDLTSTVDKHYIHASVGKTDATVFNKLLNPLLLVKIKSGEILGMNLSYTGDDYGCKGKMDFEYENFKIDIFNSEYHSKKQGLLSLAANTVIKSTNRKGNGTYTEGIIKAVREQNKFIFPFIWKAVQSGIVYTMAPVMSDIKKEEKAAKKESKKK